MEPRGLRRDQLAAAIAPSALCSVTLLGCRGTSVHEDAAVSHALTVKDARDALVDLVERTDHEALKMSLPILKTSEPKTDAEGNLTIGPWIIDLNERRFVVSIVAEPILEEYGGKFTITSEKGWTATIDQKTRN